MPRMHGKMTTSLSRWMATCPMGISSQLAPVLSIEDKISAAHSASMFSRACTRCVWSAYQRTAENLAEVSNSSGLNEVLLAQFRMPLTCTQGNGSWILPVTWCAVGSSKL